MNKKNLFIIISIILMMTAPGCKAPEYPSLSGNSILFFYFDDAQNPGLDQDVVGQIYGTDILLTVPEGTDITALVPTIVVSENALVSPLTGVAGDFTSSAVYTVTSEMGISREYTVSVTGNLSSAKEITSFVFYADDNAALALDVVGTFNGTTINAVVPYGTDVTALVPAITLTPGSAISPPGSAAQDFTEQFTYTVTAVDESTQDYYVVVIIADLVDTDPPVPGNSGLLSFDEISGTSITFSWTAADDDVTVQENLVYKAVMSASDNISTAEDAELNGTAVSGWMANITSAEASGLTENTTYYFNVLVRDVAGNVEAYTRVWQTSLDVLCGQTLTADDGTSNDAFGNGLAVSGDGSTIVVGARYEDLTENNEGAAYVFEHNGSEWVQTAKLTAEAQVYDGVFGSSVAISGDGDTIVVGKPHDNYDGQNDRGSAYVFEKGAGWTDTSGTVKLVSSSGAANDYFGNSVDISEDGSVIIIGAVGDNASSSNSGAAYIFERPGGKNTWALAEENARLLNGDPASGGNFGRNVVISADGSIAAAAAEGRDAVYVFERNTGWMDGSNNQVAKLTPSSCHTIWEVEMSSDGSTIIASDRYLDVDVNVDSGAAFVFQKPPAGWSSWVTGTDIQTATIYPMTPQAYAHAGESLAVNEDASIVIMGEMNYDGVTLTNQGRTSIFYRPETGWEDKYADAELEPSSQMANDYFGAACAVSSDGNVIVAGADQNGAARPGFADIFQ